MRILFLIAILPLALAYWSPPAKACKDTYAHCDRRTHCPRYQNVCKQTCGLCRKTQTPHFPHPNPPHLKERCKDSYAHCDRRTHCPRYQNACKQTCGLCRRTKTPHFPHPKPPHLKKRCKDSYAHCDKLIHCPRYKNACKKTCGLCRNSRKPKLPYPMQPKLQCHDDLPHCADWNVDCKVYGDGCKKTCGLCNPGHKDDTGCTDYYPDCPQIASNNWCPIYKEKCCKSCKKAAKKENPRCKDEASGCPRHKAFMCKAYPKKCKKTCGLCGGFGRPFGR